MFDGVFFVFSAFKENVIEGDGPKNQTQSKMDMYETTVNAVLVSDYNQKLSRACIAHLTNLQTLGCNCYAMLSTHHS
jgi:hypothetical protein